MARHAKSIRRGLKDETNPRVTLIKPRTTPHDRLTAEVAAEVAHWNSYTIHGRIRVLRCEAEELDKSAVALSGTLDSVRERRKKVEATLRGLTSVVEKR